jgi:hypothetical protein
MGRWQNSIALAKASWGVLREDKKLALLPLCSMIASIITAALFALPVWALNSDTGSSGGVNPVSWIVILLGYVALAFVVIFFNAALVFAADRRLRGEPITLGEALGEAAQRIPVLLPWAIVSATVSVIIRAIEERAGLFGRIVGAFAGAAWTVVTFLVLPILVFEGIGPIAAVKRSGSLFKKTWGENLIANAGIGIAAMLVLFAGAIPLVLLAVVGSGGPVTFVAIGLLVVWAIGVSLVASALTGILQTALYRFATGGEVLAFPAAQLQGAFQPRGQQRGIFN